MPLLIGVPLKADDEPTRHRLALISISKALLLLAILLLSLMPYDNFADNIDIPVERNVVVLVSAVALVLYPLAIIAATVSHETINNSLLLTMAGIGSGCLCCVSGCTVVVNIILATIDLARGHFRVYALEIVSINILMVSLTAMFYFAATFCRRVQLIASDDDQQNNNAMAGEAAARNSSASYGSNSGSYDLTDTGHANATPKNSRTVTVVPNLTFA